jgi:hypothetical protein
VYSTSVYIYTPRQTVVVYSGNSSRRYQLVYAKNLRLNKGVDNKIQFQFLNQEQKAFDITDKEITFRLINQTGTTVLLQKAITNTLALNGLCELVATSADLEDIDTQYCSYSLEFTDAGLTLPVFVNSEASARGVIQVVDSVLPAHMPSFEVAIPTHPQANATVVTYFSSVMNTADSPVLTIQPFMSEFSGSLQVQGSTTGTTEWYNIGNAYTYLTATQTDGYTITGFHPFVRIKILSTEGDITQILAR